MSTWAVHVTVLQFLIGSFADGKYFTSKVKGLASQRVIEIHRYDILVEGNHFPVQGISVLVLHG